MFNQTDSDNESVADEPEGWVKIQQNTFTNWCNDKLRGDSILLTDIRKDFRDGINLCTLIKVLRCNKPMGKVIHSKGKKINTYTASGNLNVAFEALRDDGVRVVNIGVEDIRDGNRKLILGMIWTLIRRYQIGSETKLAPKKLMLAWINGVLHPYMSVSNFTDHFNDGQALQGIINFCQPGSFPNWTSLQRSDRRGNCEAAMKKAEQLFGIPLVVSPENMASDDLDELSGMTYMSYFMSVDSCGFKATLKWVHERVPVPSITNFDTDWNNGVVASELATSCGGAVAGFQDHRVTGPDETACQNAIQASHQIISQMPIILTGMDLANPKVDHIGVMAYAVWHKHASGAPPPPPPPPPPDPVPTLIPPVIPIPTPSPPPTEVPNVLVTYNNPWKIDTPLTIVVDTSAVGRELVYITANSPCREIEDLVVSRVDEYKFLAVLCPSETGDWTLEVFYSNERLEVQNSPFPLHVFDPSKASISNGTGGTIPVHTTGCHDVNCLGADLDDVTGQVIYKADNSYVNHQIVKTGVAQKTIQFFPDRPGIHIITLFLGGTELAGSPFEVNVLPDGIGVTAYGQGLEKAIQYNEIDFIINCANNPNGKPEVTIQAPSGDFVMVDMENCPNSENTKSIKYTPLELGNHIVMVKYNDVEVPGSPFIVNIREPVVHVKNLRPTIIRDRTYTFEVDAHECKKGQLCLDTGLSIHRYDKLGYNTYAVEFISRKKGDFDMIVTYNDREVKGSPFKVKVDDTE